MKALIKIQKEFDIKYLEVDAYVRYWEDAEVNGVIEDSENPTIPGINGEMWNITINVDTGHIIGWPKGVTANVHYKVCDEGTYTLKDQDMQEIVRVESYVPECLSPLDSGYGDYIIMEINGEGKIDGFVFTQDDVDDIIENDFNYKS